MYSVIIVIFQIHLKFAMKYLQYDWVAVQGLIKKYGSTC